MLDKLFGSTTRVKLLRLFCRRPSATYYLREIARKIKSSVNATRRELNNLEALGFLSVIEQKEVKEKKKYYGVNLDYVFFPELKSLILKDQIILKNNIARLVREMRGIKLLILTGFFTETVDIPTDILIVGRINRTHLKRLLSKFHRSFDQPLHYTVMTEDEYQYRLDITDRFLYNILEHKHIRVIDKQKVEKI